MVVCVSTEIKMLSDPQTDIFRVYSADVLKDLAISYGYCQGNLTGVKIIYHVLCNRMRLRGCIILVGQDMQGDYGGAKSTWTKLFTSVQCPFCFDP